MKPNGPLRVRLVSFYTLKSYIIVKPLQCLVYKQSTSIQLGIGDKILPNDNKIFYSFGSERLNLIKWWSLAQILNKWWSLT